MLKDDVHIYVATQKQIGIFVSTHPPSLENVDTVKDKGGVHRPF